MPISIREAKASPQDREWIEQAYGEYLADLAADQTGVFPSLTVTGAVNARRCLRCCCRVVPASTSVST